MKKSDSYKKYKSKPCKGNHKSDLTKHSQSKKTMLKELMSKIILQEMIKMWSAKLPFRSSTIFWKNIKNNLVDSAHFIKQN